MNQESSRAVPKIKGSDVRGAARNALALLLEPLAGFILDTGTSAHEFEELFRNAIVRSAAQRQLELTGRLSISGISAVTGIPRAEISKILKKRVGESDVDAQQQATNRILSAWHDDPKYSNANGSPADLAVFGAAPSFDSLVRAHGRGIPTRAMLDELTRTGSVEVLSTKRVRVKALVAVDHGVGSQAVKAFGDRGADFMRVMLMNMRNPDRFRFVSSVEGSIPVPELLPMFRKEVSSRGQNFLAGIRETLFAGQARESSKVQRGRVLRTRVTVYYSEFDRESPAKAVTPEARRNFRRKA